MGASLSQALCGLKHFIKYPSVVIAFADGQSKAEKEPFFHKTSIVGRIKTKSRYLGKALMKNKMNAEAY
jgi:hypothetical protein